MRDRLKNRTLCKTEQSERENKEHKAKTRTYKRGGNKGEESKNSGVRSKRDRQTDRQTETETDRQTETESHTHTHTKRKGKDRHSVSITPLTGSPKTINSCERETQTDRQRQKYIDTDRQG